jgi:crossover junction endodeoxyribonuclease RuvC
VKILGVDPGLDACGYGIIQTHNGRDLRLVEAGLIRTQKSESLPQRLAQVAQNLKALIGEHRPNLMAVEDLYSYYKTPKPAILMGHVRGVVLETAALSNIPVKSYLPTKIKQSVVGKGHASKDRVARMVRMRLELPEGKVRADVTDALAVALCHADTLQAQSAGMCLAPMLF